MVQQLYNFYNNILAENPLWPAETVRKILGGSPENPSTFSNVADFYTSLKDVIPKEMNSAVGVLDSLAPADNPPGIRRFLSHLYDEGVALTSVLGEDAILAKYPSFDKAKIAEGIKQFGDLEKFSGYLHIRRFFDLAVEGNKLEYLRDSGLPHELVEKGLKEIRLNLDESGYHGIHRLLAENPSIKQRYLADISHINVKYALGKETHGITTESSKTRAGYLSQELKHVQETLAHSPQIAEEYKSRSYLHAAGEHYLNQASSMVNFHTDCENIKPLFANRQYTPQKFIQEITSNLASGASDKQLNLAVKSGNEFLHRYGMAFLDPVFVNKLVDSNAISQETLRAVDWMIHGGNSNLVVPHIRSAILNTTEVKPTVLNEKPALPAPEAQKKTSPIEGTGSSESKSSSYHSSGETTKEGAAGQSKSAEWRAESKSSNYHSSGEATKEMLAGQSKFTGLRAGGSAIFGIALIDGLIHLKNEESQDRENKSKKVSYSRVFETCIGAAGIAACWLLKDSVIKQVFKGSGR